MRPNSNALGVLLATPLHNANSGVEAGLTRDSRVAEACASVHYTACPSLTEGLWSVIARAGHGEVGHAVRSDIGSRQLAELEA